MNTAQLTFLTSIKDGRAQFAFPDLFEANKCTISCHSADLKPWKNAQTASQCLYLTSNISTHRLTTDNIYASNIVACLPVSKTKNKSSLFSVPLRVWCNMSSNIVKLQLVDENLDPVSDVTGTLLIGIEGPIMNPFLI